MSKGATFIFWLALVSSAQSPTGEIRLNVRDPFGAQMQVRGKVEELSTRASPTLRTFETDSRGSYAITQLPFGHYRVTLSKTAFADGSLVIDVQSSTPVERAVTMKLGAGRGDSVTVIATTPLPGMQVPLDQIAAPIQTAGQAEIADSGALDLPDFLNRRLSGVYLNEIQGNPFQPDVNYRGYTASPLLGTPQGLSVYLDGVRQNQPFGDVVSWDLIPRNAISEITLIPGSNPVFGANTLGGALSIETKDGTRDPGLEVRLTYGSSGRKAVQAEFGGGAASGFHWFFAANAFHESGWRYDSPSDVRQGFGKLGWRGPKTEVALTLAYAYNTLTGNGLQDFRLLAQNYSSVYTVPDTTGNRSPSFSLLARHSFSNALTFSGNTWFRNIRTEGVNGNINTNSFSESIYQPSAADQAALLAAGYQGFPPLGANASNTPFPFWRCVAQGLQHSEPVENCDALTVYSKAVQNDYGVSGQLTWVTSARGFHNQLVAGASYDRGVVDFTQNIQLGFLNPDRSITGINAWEDGSTASNGVPVDSRVDLHGASPYWSLFATDTLSLGKRWNLTMSGRYNRRRVDNADRISPLAGPGSLDGHYGFGRLDPSVGVTFNPSRSLTAYASYAQGSRAPTSIELGCADPQNPCHLPNALASDPPLKQVLTQTWEAGLRGALWRTVNWTVGAYRAENRDDILFVASPQTGAGYFKNFGKTLREGASASIDGRFGKVSGGLDYSFVNATYRSLETVDGSANNTNDAALAGTAGLDGVITIHPGNRIPLVPKQTGKAYLTVRANARLVVDLGLLAASSSYARGNENNAYRPDAQFYLGPGVSPGYAVVNLTAHYDLTRRLQIGVQVDNLFDRHYDTAAQLAATGLTAEGTVLARPFPAYPSGDFPIQHAAFFAPGAPRRVWIDLRYRF